MVGISSKSSYILLSDVFSSLPHSLKSIANFTVLIISKKLLLVIWGCKTRVRVNIESYLTISMVHDIAELQWINPLSQLYTLWPCSVSYGLSWINMDWRYHLSQNILLNHSLTVQGLTVISRHVERCDCVCHYFYRCSFRLCQNPFLQRLCLKHRDSRRQCVHVLLGLPGPSRCMLQVRLHVVKLRCSRSTLVKAGVGRDRPSTGGSRTTVRLPAGVVLSSIYWLVW
jgi:hypothetical protein